VGTELVALHKDTVGSVAEVIRHKKFWPSCSSGNTYSLEPKISLLLVKFNDTLCV
jgi:hypothetical protein